jgi:hypothetical protein
MTGRLALLGFLIATMPLSVDAPADGGAGGPGETRLRVEGGAGQFAVVSRGCQNEVLSVVHHQLRAGALVVEHQFPQDLVLGIRAGNVHTDWHNSTVVPDPGALYGYRDSSWVQGLGNVYVNPFLAYESRWAGMGVGFLQSDRGFRIGSSVSRPFNTTWHVRIGDPRMQFTARWMEDVPLESEGHLSVALDTRPSKHWDAGAFAGLFGPYDGSMLGLRGRVWLTPDAALQVRASVAGHHEYAVFGGFQARYRWGH